MINPDDIPGTLLELPLDAEHIQRIHVVPVPRTFLVVVIFWLSMTFGSFGLSAPKNATVVTVFVISTLSVAAAVFLILELDGAFEGIIRISSEPFRYTLANLGR